MCENGTSHQMAQFHATYMMIMMMMIKKLYFNCHFTERKTLFFLTQFAVTKKQRQTFHCRSSAVRKQTVLKTDCNE
jgi:hypothetical protein